MIPRKYENIPVSLNINSTVQKLSILIENQGRINYGSFMEDRKVSVVYILAYRLVIEFILCIGYF